MPFLLSFVVEVADTLSRIVFRSFSLSLLLLTASGTICAQAQDPFTQNRLPDLGMMPESHEGEKHFAEMAKAFGEASMKNNDLDTGEQARQFAFGQVRDVVSEQVNQQLESWLSARAAPAWILTSITKVILTAVAEAGLSLYRINSAI